MPVSPLSIGWVAARAAVARTAAIDPVGRLPRRVSLRWVDANLHMNYASYLEVMELARWDWALRTGQARWWWRDGIRPVVGSLEIRYHHELRPLQRFVVETRAVGFDRRAVVVEHVAVVGD